MIENASLGQIQENIEFQRLRLETLFKTLNSADNILANRDHLWGKRTINLFLRMDEISINKIEELIPTIRQVLVEYNQLRKLENELTEAALITRRIQHDNLEGIMLKNQYPTKKF